MRKPWALSLVVVLALSVALPASAEDPVPTFRQQRVWFHCIDDLKPQNVPSLQGGAVPWDTTPPPGSVQEGHGCGHLEYGVGGDQFDPVFSGTFTGNLDRLTVHLHEMAHADRQPFGTEVLLVLEVDGVTRLNLTPAQAVPAMEENSGVTNSVTFSITGLGYRAEDGDGSTPRNITLKVKSPLRGAALWVWDTTEVPAGITFNPSSLAPTVFPAE